MILDGAVLADDMVRLADSTLLAAGASLGLRERLVLFVFDLPLDDLLAALAHGRHMHLIEAHLLWRLVVQIVLEYMTIFVFLCTCARRVAALCAHAFISVNMKWQKVSLLEFRYIAQYLLLAQRF